MTVTQQCGPVSFLREELDAASADLSGPPERPSAGAALPAMPSTTRLCPDLGCVGQAPAPA
jgi:hypothetical protein